ncbi:hypothetical protein EHS13_04195 [Paenibacillus psychroresistens]|uniref:Uncharacterized protein n=1 Tax=Paenibacillus psychroresistens TaxID=1778678 RepID=A0A6B8RF64_9BACL|nr:hypothetical protein [Paenibacillus psychroresistens]QGQ94163.1 hypothetical protein EHS13_04195 [Paenibacillus psychroresistens]
MPRIEKVRLVGIKYDSMRKQYADTTLDFINGSEPQHTLLALMNGGGKGLLLQMLFQLLMPLTKWGAKSENRIEALFYNDHKQFVPYTFHVVIEWRLDTYPVKWLTTGIAVTAQEKTDSGDSDGEGAEPRYMLYTHEFTKPSDYEIEALPLIDQGTKKTVSFQEWKEFLNKHKAQFRTYTANQTKDYFELLLTFDIDRKEWELLRDINRQEGGVEAFFKKGQDNHALFHHLIIPEISRHLTSTDEVGKIGTLLDIFKNNARIAQNLPKLLKREDAFLHLLQLLEPLIGSLEQSALHEGKQQLHSDEGNVIHHALREWKGEQEQEKLKWEQSKLESEGQLKVLLWQEDNLEYARKWKDWQSYQQQASETELKLNETQLQLQVNVKQEIQQHTAVLWNERQLMLRDRKLIQDQVRELQQQSEHKDLQQEMQTILPLLEAEWQQVSEHWEQALSVYELELTSIKGSRDDVQAHNERLNEEINGLSEQIGGLNAKQQQWNNEAMTMVQRFGQAANEKPEVLVKQFDGVWEQRSEVLKAVQKDKQQAEKEKEASIKARQSLLTTLGFLQKEWNQMTLKRDEKRSEEERLAHKLAGFLRIACSWAPAVSRQWLQDKKQQLEQLIAARKAELTSQQQAFWTHQLDTALAQNDYWIPNQAVSTLKSTLEAQGINVAYGTQLLQSMPSEQSLQLLTTNPLLPYGIVLLERDWRKLDLVKLRLLLLRAPVPIYLRETMESAQMLLEEPNQEFISLQNGGLLLRDEGLRMSVEQDHYKQWQISLNEQTSIMQENIGLIEAQIEQGEALYAELELDSAQADSLALGLVLDQLTEELQSQADLEIKTAQKLTLITEQLKTYEATIEEIRKEIAQCDADLKTLRDWTVKCKEYQQWRSQKKSLQAEKLELQTKLTANAALSKEIDSDLFALDRAALHWKEAQKSLLQQLQVSLTSIDFNFERLSHERLDESVNQTASGLFAQDHSSNLKHLITKWQGLSQTLEQNNIELVRLNVSLAYKQDGLKAKESELDLLNGEWREESFAELAMEVLRSEWQKATGVRLAKELELQAYKNGHLEFVTQAKLTSQDVERLAVKNSDKHGRVAEAWEGEDLSLREAELKLGLDKAYTFLAECSHLLATYESRLANLGYLMKLIISQTISQTAVFEIPAAIRQTVKIGADQLVNQWIEQNKRLADKRGSLRATVLSTKENFLQTIRAQAWDSELKESLQRTLLPVQWDQYDPTLELLRSMKEHAHYEIETLLLDKLKSEHARELWTSRASKHVISIIKSMRSMASRMTIINQSGHRFPLVKMEMKQGDLPEREEDIQLLLKGYFVSCIEELLAKFESLESVPDAVLAEWMNDSKIVMVALKNRYPVMYIYKPQTTNVFYYETPKKHHYTEWETLNKGSITEAKGSGGQLLAARTLIMMMLLTHKRQIRQTKQWSVLISDNPFGQAVSVHILDPIFAIAEVLNFQWVVLAPPELIKMDVSRRFPVFWELELKRSTQGETIIEQLQHGGRTFEDQLSLFD